MKPKCLFAASALCIASLAGAIASAAEPLESQDRIRALAREHALDVIGTIAPADAEVMAEAAQLDSRLRLPECPAEPETFSSNNQLGSQMTVGVRCPTGPGWSLYVPVRIQVRAPVLVMTSSIPRGTSISASDVTVDVRDIGSLSSGYLVSVEQVDGMLLRRSVPPGTVLTPALIEYPTLVRRGNIVSVLSSSGPISVTSEGEALGDGAEGDRLKVRNPLSKRVVEGIIRADGTVIVRR